MPPGSEDILSSVLSRVLTQDSEKIRRTLEETDRAAFAQAVEAIVTAREARSPPRWQSVPRWIR